MTAVAQGTSQWVSRKGDIRFRFKDFLVLTVMDPAISTRVSPVKLFERLTTVNKEYLG